MISLRTIHYQTGILVSAFLIVFAVTGILLQHTNGLKLNAHYAPAWLVSPLYGVKVTTSTHYHLKKHWVASAGGWLYLDGQPVSGVIVNNIQGAVWTKEGIWVAVNEELLLLAKTRLIIDRRSTREGLPERITSIGKDQHGGLIVASASGNWKVTEDLRFESAGNTNERITWSEIHQTSPAQALLEQQILQHANDHLITWERAITDLHSGQIGGTIGQVVAHLMGFLILLVATAGVVLWFRSRPIRRSSP